MASSPHGHEKRRAQQSEKKLDEHFPYWVFPLIGAAVWFSMLWSLLIVWVSQRQPRYSTMNSVQQLPYISDIGANTLKPFFIAACATTATSFSASLLSVRHNHALVGRVEQLYDRISVVSGITGSVGLVALAVFDTARHHDLHFFCLLVFMGGVILSAASTTYEYSHIGKAFKDFEILRVIYFVKLVLVLVEMALSIFFIGAILGKWYLAASCTEWVIAYIYTFYILTFFFDLSPSARTKDQEELRQRRESERGSEQTHPTLLITSVS